MNALIVHGASDVRIDMDVAALEARSALVQRAERILAVADEANANDAAAMVRELRAMMRDVETTRQAVKEPVLQLGRQIDAMAKDFAGCLAAQSERISRLLTAFNIEQERIRREAEAQRQKAIRDAQEAERKAKDEADAARRKAEADAAEAAKADDPFAEAEAEAAKAQAEQEARQKIEDARKAAAVVPAAVPVAPKAAGTAMRTDPEFRIDDLLSFAISRPDLVTITPKRADILAEMRKLQPWEGEAPIVVGTTNGSPVAVGWWERKAVVR